MARPHGIVAPRTTDDPALRREDLDRMGEGGKRYYWRNFDFEKRIGALCALLEDGKDGPSVS